MSEETYGCDLFAPNDEETIAENGTLENEQQFGLNSKAS